MRTGISIISVIPLTLLVGDAQAPLNGSTFCGPGQHLGYNTATGQEQCLDCDRGYYMDKPHHREVACIKCTPGPNYPIGRFKEVKPCTLKSDRREVCRPGFYALKRYGSSFRCRPCMACKFYEQICTQEHNSKCRPPGYTEAPDKILTTKIPFKDQNVTKFPDLEKSSTVYYSNCTHVKQNVKNEKCTFDGHVVTVIACVSFLCGMIFQWLLSISLPRMVKHLRERRYSVTSQELEVFAITSDPIIRCNKSHHESDEDIKNNSQED